LAAMPQRLVLVICSLFPLPSGAGCKGKKLFSLCKRSREYFFSFFSSLLHPAGPCYGGFQNRFPLEAGAKVRSFSEVAKEKGEIFSISFPLPSPAATAWPADPPCLSNGMQR
ncbi:hypothetical protein, partial [Pontibacter qinzhouensis]|uniref:hypothetical protein n=1 Tax=Pontibacter qinzhouensis TaxID=2603253 RepID=UPI001C9C9CC9